MAVEIVRLGDLAQEVGDEGRGIVLGRDTRHDRDELVATEPRQRRTGRQPAPGRGGFVLVVRGAARGAMGRRLLFERAHLVFHPRRKAVGPERHQRTRRQRARIADAVGPVRPRVLHQPGPPLAHQALSTLPQIGLMLPCNVTVDQVEEGVVEISFIDPIMMMGVVGDSRLEPIAKEARERLERAARSLELE